MKFFIFGPYPLKPNKQLSMPKFTTDEKWALLAGVFLLFLASTWVFDQIDARRTYKALMNSEKIQRIDLRVDSLR
jgi:hypothetical protein